ncbi:MAG TPA: hypothetical protein EYQ50_00620 [Verrucomicrobiales bacterium]|nr:hypothetical protein [Verrucomicrobiales bacterium]
MKIPFLFIAKATTFLFLTSSIALTEELPTLVISEFMAANDSVLQDSDGDYSDWIEIFNYGKERINLEGLRLTDNRKKKTHWSFPDLKLNPGSYKIIFASGKNLSNPGTELHTDFRLGKNEDYLAFLSSDGKTVIHEFGPGYPTQKKDIAFGLPPGWNPSDLKSDSGSFLYSPTPGNSNSKALKGAVAQVSLTTKRGFYTDPFNLTLNTKTPGAQIRFTTNGSIPAHDQGRVYDHPIRIDKTTVLRIAAFKSGFHSSKIKTHTFIFPEDVIHQSPDGLPPVGFPWMWGKNKVNYGMDPRVVNDPRFQDEIVEGLTAIPSFSLVTGMDDLFGEERGIYSNPGEQGREWEKACSLELLNPDGKKAFQIDCGFRIRGGFSRVTMNAKHALRLFFRDVYGPTKLEHSLFGKQGTKKFDNLDLRTFQNYSWSMQGDPRGIFIRDQFNRDLQLAMGEPGVRGDFCHLYINGHYWGLYDTCERPEASYGASYFGGEKEEYDVIKVDSGFTTRRSTYTVIPTDGNLEAWTRLYDKAALGLANNKDYFELQGKNAEGTPHKAYETLLDTDNLINYMLVIFYGGNLDAPVTKFGGNRGPNNWHGMRNRNGNEGFQFFVWDAEHTFLDVNEDRTGPFNTGASVEYSSPQWIWQQCLDNVEFRLKTADYIQKYFFNGGLLTAENISDRFFARAMQIESAVICESARWGDVEYLWKMDPPDRIDENGNAIEGPLNRDDDWRKELNRILSDYIPKRSDIVLGQLYRHGLIPDVAAPKLNQNGGRVKSGFQVTLSSDAGKIFYTTDGSDPRRVGGTISDSAREYQSSIVLRKDAVIKSRVFLEKDWSALTEAEFRTK